jgi:serine/threonine protein kinase
MLPTMLHPGLVLPGREPGHDLVLRHPIGSGAMGQVWVAYHHGFRSDVAVKLVLDAALHLVPNADARLLREAQNASRIQSPHAVRTFDFALTPAGIPYIVMELLHGETLDAHLARAGALSPAETWRVLRHVGAALDDARGLGIVHRDIKPQNIFVCRDHAGEVTVKVLDFGNAKSIVDPLQHNLSTPGLLAGSPAYVSRDLLLHPDRLDHHVDLWALAVTAFKCLTGELPFKGYSLIHTVQAIIDGAAKTPSTLRPELGWACDAWFERAFDFDPALRPRSGAEMAESFAEVMGLAAPAPRPSSVWSTPPSSSIPEPRRTRRGMRVAVAAAAAVLVAGVGLAACVYTPASAAAARTTQLP